MNYFLLIILLFILSCTVPSKKEELKLEAHQVYLDHEYFEILYDTNHRLPVWVRYNVTNNHIVGSAKRRDNFHKDIILEQMSIKPVGKNDYRGSGFDRGHMAPAADFKFSQKAMDKTFVMSNIAPQTATLNRVTWKKLEEQVRRWICGEESLTIYTGPILTNGLSKMKSGISVPEKFYKVIYDETPPKKSIAFIYSQQESDSSYKNKIIPISKLEKKAGIRFSRSKKGYPEKDISEWSSCQ